METNNFQNNHTQDKKLYQNVHAWVRYHYGSATKCQNNKCLGISKCYQWALKHGKTYEKNIKNYKQLCRQCHSIYDVTEHTREISREKCINTNKRYCCNGHEFSEENTYLRGKDDIWRGCRICHNNRVKKYNKNNPDKVKITKKQSNRNYYLLNREKILLKLKLK